MMVWPYMMSGWMGIGGPMGRTPSPRDRLGDIDIDAEYDLIRKKKSNLTASLRREVVRRYKQEHGE